MTFFDNYNAAIRPDYQSREERNIFFASFIKDHLALNSPKILNIGSGGERFLARCMPEALLYDVDIQGDADLVVDLETLQRLDFNENHFDISCALDLLEHIENLHTVLDEMIRVTSRHIVISLPNPQQTFLEMLRDQKQEQKGKSHLQTGVYSKFYGLPVSKPVDRHKWHYTIDDVRRLFEYVQEKHDIKRVTYFSGYQKNWKKACVRALVPNRIYYNLFLPYIWIWLEKN